MDTILNFLKECGASLLVTDFSPLREVQHWKVEILIRVNESVSVHQVDAHTIVRVWVASDKVEYMVLGPYPEYLIEFPELTSP